MRKALISGKVKRPWFRGVHRVNRVEYANSVRDLLGVEIDPAEFCQSMIRFRLRQPGRQFDLVSGSCGRFRIAAGESAGSRSVIDWLD